MQKKKVLLVPVLSLFDRIYYFSNFDVRSMSMALSEAKLVEEKKTAMQGMAYELWILLCTGREEEGGSKLES